MSDFAATALKALKLERKRFDALSPELQRVEARKMLAKVYPKSLLPKKLLDTKADAYVKEVAKLIWAREDSVDVFTDEQPPRVVIMKYGLLIGYVSIPRDRTGPLMWHDGDGEESPLSELVPNEYKPIRLTPAQKTIYGLLKEHGPVDSHSLAKIYFPTAIKRNGQPYNQSLDSTRKVLYNLQDLKAAKQSAKGWVYIDPLPNAKKKPEPTPIPMSAAERKVEYRAELITLIQEMEVRACQCDAAEGAVCDCHGTINKMLQLVDSLSK